MFAPMEKSARYAMPPSALVATTPALHLRYDRGANLSV